jgi:hypothetical protein
MEAVRRNLEKAKMVLSSKPAGGSPFKVVPMSKAAVLRGC